ncbi:E3 ubiquitin-protein ligase TRIM39-like [Mauremys reevesii]|uniref:E3 ubiquitin-protein ligase TRIM39-like n=1 Tax=Mauremys reevesii TaxID=260615 RepID=UPI0019400340|nr:E3 ubiquitin-protein ligase TRIM39-like [Mauremys reevesii]
MATENPVESLQDETSCPICLEYFQDPVIIDCGHNFCRACISLCWEGPDTEVSCPQCRETAQQRNLRPNRQLANVVEIAKRLSFQAGTGSGEESVCDEHQEPLKLFCEEDQTLICVVCDRSRTHRAHTVVPIEEAAEEYKEKIQAHLEILREEREKLLRFKVTGEGKSLEYLIQTQNKRQKVVSEFQQLRQFLEEEEQLLLAQLENLEQEILKIQNDNVTKMSEEISHLSNLISELERKCQKPAIEFLQDVRSTLSRCEKEEFLQPVEISPELEKRLSDLSQRNIAVTEILWKFKDTLQSELETIRGKSLGSHRPGHATWGQDGARRQGSGWCGAQAYTDVLGDWYKGGPDGCPAANTVNVTLDPDTAHPRLILSEDQKSVRWGDTCQLLPTSPERFDSWACVLGSEGFISGRHCWEVEVGDRGFWAVGVARESVRREGEVSFNPDMGIWAVQWLGLFQALTSPATTLPLSQVPRRIQVCLDCEWGQVTFFDTDNKAPIFTFPPASVPGERIYPWLWVGAGSQLRLCP